VPTRPLAYLTDLTHSTQTHLTYAAYLTHLTYAAYLAYSMPNASSTFPGRPPSAPYPELM
jgi:hypothetical protein